MRINARMLVRIVAVTLLFEIALLAFVHTAEACACSGSGPDGARQYAEYFNSQSYEWRASANVLPPTQYGWAMTTDRYMVAMNLCGQVYECEEV